MDRITIFGRPSCGFCVRAKQLCEVKGFDFKFVNMIEEGVSKADIEQTIGKPVQTVPQIFIGETHVGGYTEFATYVHEREAASLT
ncbi:MULTISPECIES: GrxA family glutaredoxin [Marinobacter]|uniref:GrxA family glutaredoxin n=1 Tax=Marinobacter TaxID=2742 RepID=UPI000DABFF21|nr:MULTISPECIES: GrxA family glutaredoxin [Marinobacter]